MAEKMKDVLEAIRRAERLAIDAKDAADQANAMVGTWWKDNSRPWLQSEDLLMAATLTRSIAHHLRMRAEEATNER